MIEGSVRARGFGQSEALVKPERRELLGIRLRPATLSIWIGLTLWPRFVLAHAVSASLTKGDAQRIRQTPDLPCSVGGSTDSTQIPALVDEVGAGRNRAWTRLPRSKWPKSLFCEVPALSSQNLR